MSIVRQHDKRSGITYVYECKSFRDKETKKPRSTRKLIGRLDVATGQVVPTDGRMKRAQERNAIIEYEPAKQENSTRLFFGATYLFDQIGEQLGIADDLRRCFPEHHKQIQSMVYYLILEDKNPLYRFPKWGMTHKHPFGGDISSQRSSDIFMGIRQDDINDFFRLQGKRRKENEYLLYDITTISSYSAALKQVQYGHNKEDDRLPQLNLALVYGEESGLPFYFRKLPGNIPDVKTIKNLLAELGILGYKKSKLVMDKGFYSLDNINQMLKERVKFLISAKTSLKLVEKELDKIYDKIQLFQNYNDKYQLNMMTTPIAWDHGKQSKSSSRRVYLHVYYDVKRMAEHQNKFDKHLMELKRDLENGKRNIEEDNQCKQYFIVKKTSKNKKTVIIKEEAVKLAKRYYGFFVLLSNEKMDTVVALERYRNKDLIEKAFCNLKERLNLRRTSVSSEESLDGKLFVEFVALIYLSYIKNQMQSKNLFKTYTMTELLDKLDLIECFVQKGKKIRVGEILEKQKQIYLDMEVKPPL
jgi:transposase